MVSERLSQAIQALEHHPQHRRIKKLIYFVSHQHWPSDRIPQDLMQLDVLVPILLAQVTTAQDLGHLLSKRAAKLNKSKTYLPIADAISQTLAPLCQSTPTMPDYGVPEALSPSPIGAGAIYSLFDLKAALMQSTNPLKAKILIFSALYHPFSFRRQDWLNLKQRSLDKLLQTLFTTYPSFAALEQKLMQTADQLDALDQSQQVVHALLRAVLPQYRGQSLATLEKPEPEPLIQTAIDDLEIEDDMLTCQLVTQAS